MAPLDAFADPRPAAARGKSGARSFCKHPVRAAGPVAYASLVKMAHVFAAEGGYTQSTSDGPGFFNANVLIAVELLQTTE